MPAISRPRLASAAIFAIAVVVAAWHVERRLGLEPSEWWAYSLIGVVAGLMVAAGAEWIQAVAAVAATAATVAALVFSLTALELARSNEERLDRQDDQRFAEKIHLGEPPASVYEPRTRDDCIAATASEEADCHPKEDGRIWLLVINPSGIQVEDVWVRNMDPDTNEPRDEFVRIGGVERCSMYYLPHWVSDTPSAAWPDEQREGSVEFHPGDLFFSDPVGRWQRPRGGQVKSITEADYDGTLNELDPVDNGISPFSDMLPNCAG